MATTVNVVINPERVTQNAWNTFPDGGLFLTGDGKLCIKVSSGSYINIETGASISSAPASAYPCDVVIMANYK